MELGALTEPVTRKRYEWIDISKGSGIFFVVLAHSMIPNQGEPHIVAMLAFITSFVMPIYFILAGVTYNADKNRANLKAYAFSRGRQLLIPYFAIYIIMTLLFIPITGTIDTYLSPGELFFWLFYGAGPPGQPTYLWFLPVLYFGLVLFTLIEAVTHNQDPRVRWPLVVILPFLAWWITDVFSAMGILVPWRVNSVLLATAFCIIGSEIRRYRGLSWWRTGSGVRDGIIIIVLVIVTFLISQYNGFVSHPDDWLGTSTYLYMVSGTTGTIAFFMLSSISVSAFISRKLQFIGVNSQIVYECHPIFFYLVPVLLIPFGIPIVDYMATLSPYWPLRFVIASVISLPFTWLVLRNRVLSVIFTGRGVAKQRPPLEQSQ
jgi:fucose 4-O-acetylase-like acetyltransferase